MTSQFLTRFAFVLTFAAASAGAHLATAQTSLGWGQHVSSYGSGYVGNAPNTIPMTSFYRAPAVATYGQPATAFYAPSVGVPATVGYAPASAYAQATGYSPGVSYRLGTEGAAPYTAAYSPIVTPTTPYAANWQYPPQTVMPTVANYAPAPPYYVTNYARTPVTTYRPVMVLSPVGVQQTVLQPCTGYECQARRHHGFFSWLFHHHRTPVAAPVAAPVTIPVITPGAPVGAAVTNYPCAPTSACATGACPQSGAATQPYYTPGPAGTSIPANTIPSLGSPPASYPLGSSSTTIAPPGASINVVPSNGLNSSGSQRLDYPPVGDTYTPNVSPRFPLTPITPGTLDTNGNGIADEAPMLKSPSNAPVGNGVKEEYQVPADEGARRQNRPQYNTQTQQPPRAIIRRDSSVTPIPDPEYPNGTKAKVNKAPMLISPRDKTAQTSQSDAQLASFEKETPAPAKAPIDALAPAVRKVLGDEVWRSAKQ